LGSGGGSCLPSIVVVAPGEPGTPITCCVKADAELNAIKLALNSAARGTFTIDASRLKCLQRLQSLLRPLMRVKAFRPKISGWLNMAVEAAIALADHLKVFGPSRPAPRRNFPLAPA
jgi:hypothetical protein